MIFFQVLPLIFWIFSYGYFFTIESSYIVSWLSVILGLLLITKQTEQKIIIGFYVLINALISKIFGHISGETYFMFTSFFTTLSLLNYFAPEIKTSNLNQYTIHLAFYKGSHGSTQMRIGQIIGFLPVKSLSLIAKDIGLRIKDGVFQIVPNTSFNSDDYLIIDTHIPADDKFIENMFKIKGMNVKESPFSTNCISTISHLLNQIGDKYKINNKRELIPSIYLRKVLKNG